MRLQARIMWTIQNPTSEHLPYEYGLAFERFERPLNATVTMITAEPSPPLENPQEDQTEPGSGGGSEGETMIRPQSSREFNAIYTVMLPDDCYHDFAPVLPVMDTTLTWLKLQVTCGLRSIRAIRKPAGALGVTAVCSCPDSGSRFVGFLRTTRPAWQNRSRSPPLNQASKTGRLRPGLANDFRRFGRIGSQSVEPISTPAGARNNSKKNLIAWQQCILSDVDEASLRSPWIDARGCCGCPCALRLRWEQWQARRRPAPSSIPTALPAITRKLIPPDWRSTQLT